MAGIGIDEVGRGCWAGPLLVVAARAVTELPGGLTDSKLLSKKQRERMLGLLLTSCIFGEGWVSANEINKIGLAKALRLGTERALSAIKINIHDEIIMDGPVNYIPRRYKNSKCIVKADITVPLVSAASVYAKVTRDKFMASLDELYPNYHFSSHAGYGTKSHKSALENFGIIQGVHRINFKPVKILIKS